MIKTVGHFFAKAFKGALRLAGVIQADLNKPVPGIGVTPQQIGDLIAGALNPAAPAVLDSAIATLGEVTSAALALTADVRAKGYSVLIPPEVAAIIEPVITQVEKKIKRGSPAVVAVTTQS
jgi:hypothetical protein